MQRLIFSGDDIVQVELPDRTRVVKAPDPEPGLADYEGEVRASIREPLGARPLSEQVDSTSRVTIAFDDPVLPLPLMWTDLRGRAISVILEELYSKGVKRERIELICANGLHRKWKPKEIRHILGRRLFSEIGAGRIRNHDAEDTSGIVDLGSTGNGHPVRVNRAVTDSDLLIYVNINWTSMNGGWKSVLVGLGDFQCINAHHNVEVLEKGTIMDPGNEFHDILREMGGLLARQSNVFMVETVLNNRVFGALEDRLLSLEKDRQPITFKAMSVMPQSVKSTLSSFMRSSFQPVGVNAGDVDEVHPVTLEALDRQQNVRVEGQADALFLGLPNISPYSTFSKINPLLAANTALGYVYNMHRGKPPVREGGVLILVQPFLPGFNLEHHPSYVEFYEKVLPETRDPHEIEARFGEDFAYRKEYIDKYRFGYAYHGVHPLYVWCWGALALKNLSEIIVVGAVDPSIPEHLGFRNAGSVAEALNIASEILGTDFSITHLVVPPIFQTEIA